jgi:nitrate reductase NapE component
MKPRRRDFIGALMLSLVLFALVAVIVVGSIPAA